MERDLSNAKGGRSLATKFWRDEPVGSGAGYRQENTRARVRWLRPPRTGRMTEVLFGRKRRSWPDDRGAPPSSGHQPGGGAVLAFDGRLLADVAVGLWRVRAKMTDALTGLPQPELRHLYRHVQAICDVLADAGIVTQGHDGMAYDPGLSISAVAFQPTPGLDREEIVETLRPTVYLRGQVLGVGEVIVGTPIRPSPLERAEQ